MYRGRLLLSALPNIMRKRMILSTSLRMTMMKPTQTLTKESQVSKAKQAAEDNVLLAGQDLAMAHVDGQVELMSKGRGCPRAREVFMREKGALTTERAATLPPPPLRSCCYKRRAAHIHCCCIASKGAGGFLLGNDTQKL